MDRASGTLSRAIGHRIGRALLALGAASLLLPERVDAQGLSTAAMRGTVHLADGSHADGARVTVRSAATGYVSEAVVRNGQFSIVGLEASGSYSVTIRRIGAFAQRIEGVAARLGDPTELRIVLESSPVEVDSVVIVSESGQRLCCGGGTATTLSDSLIHRLPSLNRNVFDFLRLVPQVSTRVGFASGGISGGGAGFRYNSFLTNGVSERSVSGSQPPEFAGNRSLPFEAVHEYQVLLAPFDVRYGEFTGALVNTITRAGSNVVAGSAFAAMRNDALARGDDLAVSPYERWQYGLSASGPIRRDRAHLLAAAEVQALESPMAGPFLGQSPGASLPVPVQAQDLERLATILGQYGLEAGTGHEVPNHNRIRGLFGRLDAALPAWNSRVVVWVNQGRARNRPFARLGTPGTFELTSSVSESESNLRTAALQLFTTLGSVHNELSLSWRTLGFGSRTATQQPIIRVAVPSLGGGTTEVVTGTPVQSQGSSIDARDAYLRDDLMFSLGRAHLLRVGAEVEWFRIGPSGLQNAYGSWTFLSLDSLAAGQASRYEVARDFGTGSVPLDGAQVAAYVGDQWRAGDRATITGGLRADMLSMAGSAPYNRTVDSIFGRRTDATPGARLQLSPRVGFTWDLDAARRRRLRGGIGIFRVRPPLAWHHATRQSYGEGAGLLRCGTRPTDQGAPPVFDPDPLSPPAACAGGETLTSAPAGDVELAANALGLARVLRGALAVEHRLGRGLMGTLEVLGTRSRSDYGFVNLNLAGPQAIDLRGRVVYGVLGPDGRATPALLSSQFPSVIELRSSGRSDAIQLSAALEKEFEAGVALRASYTWSRVRDTDTPLRVNVRGITNWSLRAVSGRHDDLSPGISLNDIPHRVVAAATWRGPARRWLTELSLLYVGESGSPFTFRTAGADGRGDLNADGALNDPVYIPLDAGNPNEIVFTGFSSAAGADNSPDAQAARVVQQQSALESFIAATPCLRRRRGAILERNGCREPWTHTTALSLRQTLPTGDRALEVQLDVFNVLNLIDDGWGRRRVANQVLLEHVGQTTGASGQQEPVFRFEGFTPWTIDRAESAFQVQFGVRYRF